jgi:hypothetical protein
LCITADGPRQRWPLAFPGLSPAGGRVHILPSHVRDFPPPSRRNKHADSATPELSEGCVRTHACAYSGTPLPAAPPVCTQEGGSVDTNMCTLCKHRSSPDFTAQALNARLHGSSSECPDFTAQAQEGPRLHSSSSECPDFTAQTLNAQTSRLMHRRGPDFTAQTLNAPDFTAHAQERPRLHGSSSECQTVD